MSLKELEYNMIEDNIVGVIYMVNIITLIANMFPLYLDMSSCLVEGRIL